MIGINMTNPQQNEIQNKIEQFNKDINLLQYKLKKLKDARKQATKTKNRQKRIVKMNKIDNRKKQIKREINLLQGRFEQFKKKQRLLEQSKIVMSILHDRIEQFKKKRLFEKGLKRIAKMQNLSQNELNQIAEMDD